MKLPRNASGAECGEGILVKNCTSWFRHFVEHLACRFSVHTFDDSPFDQNNWPATQLQIWDEKVCRTFWPMKPWMYGCSPPRFQESLQDFVQVLVCNPCTMKASDRTSEQLGSIHYQKWHHGFSRQMQKANEDLLGSDLGTGVSVMGSCSVWLHWHTDPWTQRWSITSSKLSAAMDSA